MKSNGYSLTRQTFDWNRSFTEWKNKGDKFILHIGVTSADKFVVADENGISLDTVYAGQLGRGSWQHDSLIANTNTYGFSVANPYDNTEEQLYEVGKILTGESRRGAAWLDNERVFWCHTDGIYITNVVTKKTQSIRETCNALCYQEPTYSPALDKVILIKQQRVMFPKKLRFLTLVMMNPDGSGEEDLEIVY